MTSRDSSIEQFQALKPADFDYLETLTLKQPVRGEWGKFDAVIRLASRRGKCLHIEFQGIQDFKFDKHPFSNGYHIQIKSVKQDQMENLNYYVVENEHNVFSFYCRSFSAKITD